MKTTNPAAAHTPGPWTASYNGNDDTRIFAESVADSPRCIAKVNTPLNRGLESEANARLIASAPELLAALEDARAVLNAAGLLASTNTGRNNVVGESIDAAIAKAKGQS